MTKEELKELRERLSNLTPEEKIEHDLYLRKLATGELEGPKMGYPSLDKPWLKYYSEEAIRKDAPKNISVYDYMKSMNIKHPNRIAINYYDNLITYQELFDKVEEYAKKFYALGVRNGDIVSICMPSTPETVISFYALNKLGAICDMIDPRSNPEQMEYYLKENKSKLLILCENYYKVLLPATQKSENLEKVIVTPITQYAPLLLKIIVGMKTKKDNFVINKDNRHIYWNEFIKTDIKEPAEEDLNNDNIAIIVHSSGTTSLPKGIVLTNDNVNAIAFQYKQTTLRTDPGSKFLSVIPAFASFGMVASINLPLCLSMENILLPIVSPKIFVKNMKKYDINFTLTIPANFKVLSKEKNMKNLHGLYGPGCGGYSLNSVEEEEINKFLKEHGSPSPMLMGWGMSELSSTACLEVPECSKLLSSGIPLSKNIIAIFKPGTDEELPYNEEGEICVCGPTIMKEYLNNPEKTAKVIKTHSDGSKWLHSGDIGYIDEDGRVTPVDRIERMIIKGIDGFKIFPQKIEEAIATSKYVGTCTVVGYKEKQIGVVPKAYIVLKQEYKEFETEALEDIKNKCQEKLSIRAIPDEFEFIDAMPYTSMGKIDFKLLENGINKKEESHSHTKTKKKAKRR